MRIVASYFSMVFISFLIINSACTRVEREGHTQTQWLGSSQEEVFSNIEEQFQGFSRTMFEVSHRYQELYWAGQDQNWQFAEYQREHILEALEQGFVRRPEHKLSAQSFLTVALPAIEQAIHSEDLHNFSQAFIQLTNSCNSCHQMEEVPFITVTAPVNRNTVVNN